MFMLRRILFYLRYAWRNLRRSARWTTFAVFCIAAGVATVVALRSLGLAIADSLVENARISNHGDITISQGDPDNPFSGVNFDSGDETGTYSDSELQRVQEWVAERGGQWSGYGRFGNIQITPIDSTSAGRPQFIS